MVDNITLPRRNVGSGGRTQGIALPGPENVQQQTLRSDPGVNAPQEAFGGGAGLEAAGKQIISTADHVAVELRRQQREYDATRTSEALLNFERLGTQELQSRQTQDDPSRAGFTDDYESWLVGGKDPATGAVAMTGQAKSILDSLPEGVSDEARQRLSVEMQKSALALTKQAGALSVKAAGQRAIDAWGQVVNQAAAQTARNPDATAAVLDNLDTRLDAFRGSMDGNQQRDGMSKARQSVILSAIQGLVEQRRYIDADALLKSGRYDADLNFAARNWASAEIDRGKRTAAAEIRDQARDHFASLAATGQGIPGLDAKAASVLDDRALADFRASEQTARHVYSATQSFQFAPPDRIAASLDSFAPKPGSIHFADEQRVYAAMATAASRVLKARSDDPAGYAMQEPSVAAAYRAAQNDPSLLPDAVARSLAVQSAMGIPDRNRSVIPVSQAAAIVADMTASGGAERAADTMTTLASQYGKYWKFAYRDLVYQKLPPEMAVLGTLDLPKDAAVRVDLANALKTGRKTLADNVPTTVRNDLDKNLQDALSRWSNVELARGATDANVKTIRDATELLAYSNVARGQSSGDAARNAVDALVDSRYDILDSGPFALYAPKGNARAIEDTGMRMLRDLGAADMRDPGDLPGMPPLTPDQRKEMYLGIARRGHWVTDETGIGARLVDPLGQPVMVSDGSGNYGPLRFNFADATPDEAVPHPGTTGDVRRKLEKAVR